MPGFSRQVLVVAVALVWIAGCGNQDRYSVVSAGQQVSGETYAGHFHDETAFLARDSAGVEGADAWSPTDIVVGGSYGRVLRIQADLVSSMQFPLREPLIGLLCQPGGELQVALSSGAFWQWSDGVWQELSGLPDGHLDDLNRDDLGRPLAIDEIGNGRLHRFANGNWQELYDGGRGRPRSIWSHPDQGAWLVTSGRNILRLTESGTAWEDSLPFADDRNNLLLAGDGVGRLALTSGSDELWLRVDGTWAHHAPEQSVYVRGMFWHAGQLYGNSFGDLMVWADDHWERVADDAFEDRFQSVITKFADPLAITEDGVVYGFNGTVVSRISSAVRSVRGLAEYEGRLLAYLVDGSLYQAVDVAAGVWRWVARTASSAGNDITNALAVDDLGRLIIHTKDGLDTWDGNSLTTFLSQNVYYFQQSFDGEILFSTPSSGLGSLRSGQLTWLDPGKSVISEIRGMQRRSPDEIDVLSTDSLYRLSSRTGTRLLWSATGWDPAYLLPLSDEHAVILGAGNAREMVGDQVIDVTPLWVWSDEVVPVTLYTAYELPDGRLLGWAGGLANFMIRDQGRWQFVDPISGPNLEERSHWGQGYFLATAEHGLYFFGRNCLVRVDMGGGAP